MSTRTLALAALLIPLLARPARHAGIIAPPQISVADVRVRDVAPEVIAPFKVVA